MHINLRVATSASFCFAVAAFACVAVLAQPENRPPPAAQMIRVPLPIIGNVDNQVRRTIRQMKQRLIDREVRPILVLEFWPPLDEADGSVSEFERSLSLARFLSGKELSGIRTVAYLPRTVTGHAVLPVIACEQIIMHPDADLGHAGMAEDNLSITVRGAYREIANRRRTIPDAIALGMLDPALTVFKAETNGGIRYVLQDEADNLQDKQAIDALETVIAEGDAGRFSGRSLRIDHGFISHLAEERRQLADALDVSVLDLEPDPSANGEWRTIRIAINGPINNSVTNRVQRTIEERMKTEGTNFVLLEIDSPGGGLDASLGLASFLAGLDAAKVRTVAFLSGAARGDAALIALACDHLIMSDAATLGGSGAYEPSDQERIDLRAPVQHVCRENSKYWSLPVAIMDPSLEVKRYRLDDSAIEAFFCDDELSEQADPARWRAHETVTNGQPLQVDANRAEQLELARYVVDGPEELKQIYHLENDPTLIEPNWADELVHQLSQPHVAGTLMFFAGFALIVELTSPGVGAGAFVSTVCFSLFFWSQFLNGTANWLEIILFVLGMAFIATEIFLIPGFGVFGLGGAALIVASLVLASQTFVLPQNEYQMRQLPWSILSVVLAGAGIVSGLVVLRKYLHQAPVLRRMMLVPPVSESESDLVAPHVDLLNQTGTTTTTLVPSGRARIGAQLVDVVSDAAAIDRDVAIRVNRLDGNRVYVVPADA